MLNQGIQIMLGWWGKVLGGSESPQWPKDCLHSGLQAPSPQPTLLFVCYLWFLFQSLEALELHGLPFSRLFWLQLDDELSYFMHLFRWLVTSFLNWPIQPILSSIAFHILSVSVLLFLWLTLLFCLLAISVEDTIYTLKTPSRSTSYTMWNISIVPLPLLQILFCLL